MNNQYELKKFAKLNFLTSTNQEDIKKLTLCTTRLDLRIDGPITVNTFSPMEKKNKSLWPHNDFNYQISSLGFRASTYLKDSDIGAFGCSFTFGQGLPDDSLWPSLLSKSNGMTSYNFGQPATSIKSICDLFSIVTNVVQIKHAVFLLPPYQRLQISAKNKQTRNIDLISLIPNYTSTLASNYDLDGREIYKSLPDEELLKIFKDSVYLIEFIAETKGIKTYYSSWDQETYKVLTYMNNKLMLLPEWTSKVTHDGVVEYIDKDLARDMHHPGIKHHTHWVRQIKDFIK